MVGLDALEFCRHEHARSLVLVLIGITRPLIRGNPAGFLYLFSFRAIFWAEHGILILRRM